MLLSAYCCCCLGTGETSEAANEGLGALGSNGISESLLTPTKRSTIMDGFTPPNEEFIRMSEEEKRQSIMVWVSNIMRPWENASLDLEGQLPGTTERGD